MARRTRCCPLSQVGMKSLHRHNHSHHRDFPLARSDTVRPAVPLFPSVWRHRRGHTTHRRLQSRISQRFSVLFPDTFSKQGVFLKISFLFSPVSKVNLSWVSWLGTGFWGGEVYVAPHPPRSADGTRCWGQGQGVCLAVSLRFKN